MLGKAGATEDDKELLVHTASKGKTTHVSEFRRIDPEGYTGMITALEKLVREKDGSDNQEHDRWRKRVIAAIAGWLDATGCQAGDRVAYIKKIACRAATGKEEGEFNKLTIPQLRYVYNSFVKQRKTYERSKELTAIINPQKN